MMEAQLTKPIDLNRATREELESLPGIGEVLAERIINARPFNSVDELAKVEGIRPRLIEQLRPLVTVEAGEQGEAIAAETEEEASVEAAPAPEAEEPTGEAEASDAPEAVAEDAEPEPEEPSQPEKAAEAQIQAGPLESETPEKGKEQAEPKYITRREAWLMTIITSAAAFFFAILLTLGVLQSINGTVHYGSYVAQQSNQRQLSVIQAEINQIQQNIDSLQGQIADLQSVSQQVKDLAAQEQQLQTQMEKLDETIADMQAQVKTASQFLSGLRNLLNNLLPTTATPTPPATQSPTPTPTTAPTPTPTP